MYRVEVALRYVGTNDLIYTNEWSLNSKDQRNRSAGVASSIIKEASRPSDN